MSLIVERPTSAQVLSDGTLSTTISQNGTNFQIKDGSRAGNNLFHSFSQFSVPTGSSASFNNATDVQNIFGRVTGNSASNIDGNIQANGTANLFLLNPNGIVFGPNASLNIGGSLMGTTASSIQFSDGAELSVNPTAPSLLTISAPIGLHLEATAGSIAVNGSGHTYSSDNSALAPVVRTTSPQGLQVNAGDWTVGSSWVV